MADLRLIDRNPVADAFKSSEQAYSEQRDRDFKIEEAQRKAQQATMIDEALRQETLRLQQPQTIAPSGFGMPPGATPMPSVPSAPPPAAPMPAAQPMPAQQPVQQQPAAPQPQMQPQVQPRANYAGAVAQVPGGGAMSAQLTMQNEAARDEKQKNALISLLAFTKSGNPVDLQTYRLMAQQSGLKLPPGIEEDAQAAGTVARGMLLAEGLYKTDQELGHRFFQTWMQNGGNLEGAILAAGTPRNSRKSITILNAEGQRQLALLDEMAGTAEPVTDQSGKPIRMPAPASASNAGPADLQMVRFLMAEGIAKNAAEAWAMARQARQNPQAMFEKIYIGVYNGLVKNYMDPNEAHTQAIQRAQQVMDHLYPSGDSTALMMNRGDPNDAAPTQDAAPANEGGGFELFSPSTWFGGGNEPQLKEVPSILGSGGGGQPSAGVPGPQNYAKRARMPDGSIIYTTDGQAWYTEGGERIQ